MGYTDNDAYNLPMSGELTITITLAEYRELVRTSTLYEMEHRGEPRPLNLDSIGEAE